MADETTVIPPVVTDAGGGSSETVETPTEETEPGSSEPGTGGEEPGSGDLEHPGEGETPGEGEPGEGEGDENLEEELGLDPDVKLDRKMRSDLAKLKKIDKEAAKRLGDLYHRSQEIYRVAGNAKNAHEAIRNIKANQATIDSLGGEEGITQMQTELGNWNEEGQRFQQQDPEYIRELTLEDPEVMIGNAHNVFDVLLEHKDPKLFDLAVLPAVVTKLDQAKFGPTLDYLEGLIKEGKGQEAFDIVQGMKGWYKQVKDNNNLMQQNKQRAKTDPRQAELDRQRQDLSREKTQIYQQSIDRSLTEMNNPEIKKLVDPFFRDVKMGPAGKRRFIGGLNSEIWAAMKADKVFQRRLQATKSRGDARETAEFIHDKFAELLPIHFRTYRNELYPNYKPAGARPAAKPGEKASTNGKAPVRAVPNKIYERKDVDITGTPDILLTIGKAYLKGTKTAVQYKR